MEYRLLGRTGLRVSLLGLGSGGASRLGQAYNMSRDDSARLVRRALDAGVNMFDTAPTYGQSEALLGQALAGVPRHDYVVGTKFLPFVRGASGELLPASALRESLEQSLRRLGTDCVDILYLHGIGPDAFEAVRDRFLPELVKAREAGLIGHLGISERYQTDHPHSALVQIIEEGDFDVLMVGLNLLSPAAVVSVLPRAAARNIGIVVMCAVRSVLTNPEMMRDYIRGWQREGLLAPGAVDENAPLDWLLDTQTPTVTDAAYKFAAADPAVGSVLTGTGTIEHFEANLRAILGPRLPREKYQRVLDVFAPVERNVQPEGYGA
jgi:aryl-alcohol dehydrogenase-like predicted oxidoreductase